jgi:HK97 family phage prohead protease
MTEEGLMTQPEEAAQRLRGAREQRSAAFDFELRGAQGNDVHFTGYAALFAPSEAYVGSGPLGPFHERINNSAFDATLRSGPDLVLRTEHRNLPVARTTAGNMRLSTDTKGLLVDATLDRRDPDVRALEVKMENRNLTQMSYVFRAIRDRWNDDYTKRELLEVSLDKGDVSVVTYGANESTTARMGSLAEVADALAGLDVDAVLVEARSLENPVALLQEARSRLDHLLREMTPPEERRLTLADAMRVLEGRD